MPKAAVPADLPPPSAPARLRDILKLAADPGARSTDASALFRSESGESREGRQERKRRLAVERVRANAPINLFTPVLLNACHKHTSGAELTDIEQDFLGLARAAELDDDGIRAYGDIYAGLTPEERGALFPDTVAGLAPGDSFTYRQAAAAVVQLTGAVTDLPNVAIATDRDALAEARQLNPQDVQRYGWSTFLLKTGQEESDQAQPEQGRMPESFRLWTLQLGCEHQAFAGLEAEGDDEVYLVVNVHNPKAPQDNHFITKDYEGYRKDVYKSVELELTTGRFDQTISLSIQAWEHDYGKDKLREEINKHLKDISNALKAAIKDFDPQGKEKTALKVIRVIADVARLILNAMDDDYIGTGVDVFTPAEARERAKHDKAKPTWLKIVQYDKDNPQHELSGMGKYWLSTYVEQVT
ncbi:hypothetical protein [Streptomyces sp. NPDC003006]